MNPLVIIISTSNHEISAVRLFLLTTIILNHVQSMTSAISMNLQNLHVSCDNDTVLFMILVDLYKPHHTTDIFFDLLTVSTFYHLRASDFPFQKKQFSVSKKVKFHFDSVSLLAKLNSMKSQ